VGRLPRSVARCSLVWSAAGWRLSRREGLESGKGLSGGPLVGSGCRLRFFGAVVCCGPCIWGVLLSRSLRNWVLWGVCWVWRECLGFAGKSSSSGRVASYVVFGRRNRVGLGSGLLQWSGSIAEDMVGGRGGVVLPGVLGVCVPFVRGWFVWGFVL